MKVVKQELFCPACGAFDVWQDEDDAGDYYAGTACYCLTCSTELPDISSTRRGNAISGIPASHGPDPYRLGRYIAIRDAANRDASGAFTAQLRELHAKAVADQEARRHAAHITRSTP